MLAWGDDRVLRLLKDPGHAARLTRERIALEAAHGVGETVDGRPGLVMERLDGPDLLSVLDRRPWLLARAARILGRTHAAVQAAVAPPQLPEVRDYVRRQLADSQLVPDDLRARAFERLEQLPDGDRICHWDFQPANVLLTGRGPVVIDWAFAARGDAAADVARTRLILQAGQRLTGSPFTEALERAGRRLLVRLYLRAYRSRRPLEVAGVEPDRRARTARGRRPGGARAAAGDRPPGATRRSARAGRRAERRLPQGGRGRPTVRRPR
jgi:Ser/Thr protein kinase RdoA (MazF antagonist)